MVSGSNEDGAMTTQGVWDSYQARTLCESNHSDEPMTTGCAAMVMKSQHDSINSSPAGNGHVREPGPECGF